MNLRLRVCAVFALCLLTLHGCGTGTPAHAYLRDGGEYGTTAGRFRGRWWNYYERGASFVQGEFWSEAEADFRRALANRGADQRWARTYGLHFIPEYFPNRELGIALYYQDRTEEAIAQLESSIAQFHSARAAYYLGLARLRQVQATGADKASPSFESRATLLAQPIPGLETLLEGTARDDTYVTAIYIDDKPYPIRVSAPEVAVRHPVMLAAGKNTFTVTVEDITGKKTTETVTLASDVDGPAVSFDNPVTPGVFTGSAYDASGVASMRIAGVDATLDSSGGGVVTFRSVVATPMSEGAIEYVCIDALGNETQGTLANQTAIKNAALPRPVRLARADASIPGEPAPDWRGYLESAQDKPYHLAATLEGALPIAEIVNPINGRVFHTSEVVVDIEVESDSPIRVATLNDVSIDLVPGRNRQRTSRRIRLASLGEHAITLSAEDTQGHSSSSSITVNRQEDTIETTGRLDAALLGIVQSAEMETVADGDDYKKAVTDWLFSEFYKSNRFAGIRDRDPATLAAVLTEQQLSAALGSKAELLGIHQLVPAELLIVGKLRLWKDSVEIILEGKSTEVLGAEEVITVGYADVAGAIRTGSERADLEDLVHVLALRFLQEFPRAEGKVAQVNNETLTTTLNGVRDGIRRHHKLVVYRKGEPITDPDNPSIVLEDGQTEILGEALVSDVTDTTSKARVISRAEEYLDDPIERGYFVVSK